MSGRHPALVLALAFSGGICLGGGLGPRLGAAAAAAALGILSLAPLLGRARRSGPSAARAPWWVAAAALLGAWRGSATGPREEPPPPGDAVVTIVGTVDSPPVEVRGGAGRPGDTLFSILVRGASVPVRCSGRPPWLRGGDRVEASGRMLPGRSARNPGDRTGAGPAILLVKDPRHVRLAPRRGPLVATAVGRVRGACTEAILSVHSERLRGLILAMVLGDRRLLSDDVRDALLATGTYHVLAISGLHVVVIMLLFHRVPIPGRLAVPARWLGLIAFTLVTGASPPVVRSAVMFALHDLSTGLGRTPPSLNVLGASAALILAIEPELLGDVGFQLSFTAVLAILTWGARLESRERAAARERRMRGERRPGGRAREALVAGLLISVATGASTAPLTAYYFQRLNPLGPIWNLLALPLTLVTFLGGVGSMASALVHPAIGRPAATVVELATEPVVGLLALGARVPGSSVCLPPPPPVLVAAAFAILAAGFLGKGRRAAIVLSALALAGACAAGALGRRPPELVVLDSGARQAAMLTLPGTGSVLIDAGAPGSPATAGARLARSVLASGGRGVVAAVLTRLDDDAARGLDGLPDVLPVAGVWIPARAWRRGPGAAVSARAKDRGLTVRELETGDRLDLLTSPAVSLEAVRIGPSIGGGGRTASEPRLVLRLQSPYGAVLLVGDLDDEGLARLLVSTRDLRADVLVASRDRAPSPAWEALLDRMKPRAAVLSGPGGPGGEAALRGLEGRGIAALATWREGAVRIVAGTRTGWSASAWRARPSG